MADLSVTPIGTQVKPMPTMSLGDMMNLARGAQAYQQTEQMNPLLLQQQQQVVEQARQVNPLLLQQQQQTTRTGQIALTLEEQKERERMAMQQFLSKPENYQTNGRIDIDKLNAAVPNLAPLTGSEYVAKFTTLGQAQTQAIDAKQRLTQDQRSMIAQRFSILGRLGIQDKSAYIAEMDLLKKENPGNRDLADLIDAYKVTWNDIPSGPQLPSMAIAGANTLLSPAQQQEAFAPRAGTISSGAATFPTTTIVSPAGAPPVQTVGGTPLVTAQLGPGQREVDTGRVDMNNNPIVNVFDANGRFLGQRSGSGTPSAAQLPGGTQPTPLGGAAPPAAPGISFTAPTRFNPPGGGIDVNRDISSRQQSYRNLMEQAAQLRATNPGQARDLEDKARYILQGLNKDYGIQAQQPQGMDTGTVTPVARIPPGETQDTVNLANQVRIKALESATQVPMQNFNNNEIIKLADEALTGRGAGTLANLTGGYAVFNAVGLGGGNATALNQLGHYMALQTASLAQSAGLGTDAARNIAAESTGTINWTPDAIKKTARVNRSLATATDLFNQGVQSAFERSKGNPLSARDFQNRWSQTADINAIRLFDAMRNNDPDAFKEIVDGAGGHQSPGYNRLKNKVEDIKKLVGMQ
jgi:hypothetical protein